MRVFQICTHLNWGDGIGNNTVGMKKAIADAGYETEIFADQIDSRLPANIAKSIGELPRLDSSDLLFYRMGTWTPRNTEWLGWGGRKIMIYHNVTPGKFYDPFDGRRAERLRETIRQVKQNCGRVDRCIAMSEYSKRDLIGMGFDEHAIDVMPSPFIPFEHYVQEADAQALNTYADGRTNILFVGRLAPNKKQEDVIRVFAYYKKHLNPNARLILIGSESSKEYSHAIQSYIRQLNVPDVVFAGHIGVSHMIAMYQCADVFLCMSEHEGFCNPLVEAMYFKVPTIAYAAAAVPETLGGSAIVVESKHPPFVAALIDRLVRDRALREQIVKRQNERLKRFDPSIPADWVKNYLHRINSL